MVVEDFACIGALHFSGLVEIPHLFTLYYLHFVEIVCTMDSLMNERLSVSLYTPMSQVIGAVDQGIGIRLSRQKILISYIETHYHMPAGNFHTWIQNISSSPPAPRLREPIIQPEQNLNRQGIKATANGHRLSILRTFHLLARV